MLSRRAFLKFIPAAVALLPTAAKVAESLELPAPPTKIAPLDALNLATHRHIRRSPVLVDRIFEPDPILRLIASGRPAFVEYRGGRAIVKSLEFSDVWKTA